VYREMFGEEMNIKVVHAGLECGIIKDKLGEMDVVSIGPNLVCAHSPSEALEIESANKFWPYVKEMIKRL